MRTRSIVLAALLLLAPSVTLAQSFAVQGADRYFRVESQPTAGKRGPVVSGYVYNLTGYSYERVQLAIDAVDAAGQVSASTVGQIYGTVPANGRAYFEVPAGVGSSYRVRVISFDPVGRGAS
jgi:hypothetical protein